jgi:hypothetical protein
MRKFRQIKFFFTVPVLSLLCFLGTASAQDPAPTADAEPAPLSFIKDIQVHAFASSSYLYNFNDPASNTNRNRIFDTDHNAFKFDIGELVLLKEATNKGDVGFRTDISYGFSSPSGAKAPVGAPNIAGVRIAREDFDLQQGYVSYNAPIGNGLRIDFGKFITHVGLEVFEGYDNWNYNYSKALLYGLGQPFTHTGVRAAYSFNDRLSVLAMVANGWDAVTDTNGAKTFGLQVIGKPADNLTLYLNYAGGPESQIANVGNSHNWRNIVDGIMDLAITQKLSFILDVSYAAEQEASPMRRGRDAEWWGFEGIIRYNFNKWCTLNVRGEVFEDVDGFRTPRNAAIASPGEEQLWEISVTPEFRINRNLVVRPEFRHDASNRLSFDNHKGRMTESTQNTLAVNTIFYF